MFRSTDLYINRRLRILFRIAQVLTVLALIVTVSPRSAFALTGNGTSSSPYMISTADDLDQFRDIVNGGRTGVCGVLTNDIDLSQLSDAAERENWTPIGNASTRYYGLFNGNGHKILNLKINRSNEEYIGLFGCITYSPLNSTGYNIINLSVSGNIIGNENVGGIVGHVLNHDANNNVLVLNCINYCTITGNESVGGIVGAGSSFISNCINYGTVIGTGDYVGGIIGINYNKTIKDSISIGKVTGSARMGSITGYNSRGTITNCGWLDSMCSIGVGYNMSGGTVTNVNSFNSSQQSSVVTTAIPSISKLIFDIDKNETSTITFTTYPSQPSNRFNAASGAVRSIQATSSNTSVASVTSVNQSGGAIVIGPKGPGTATITVTASLYATNFASIGSYVTSPLSVTFTFYVTVKEVAVQSVTLSKSTLDLTVGDSFGLTASISPSNATNKAVTWSSSNSSIASVDSSGCVTAKGNGTATITVKSAANANISDTCTVNVTTPTSGVTVTPETVALNVGETKQLSAVVAPATASNKNVTWSTSSGNVATVNSSGLVTAVGNGTATITARTASGGYTDTCTVTVSTPVTGVSLSLSSLTLDKNGTHQLTATVSPETASNKTVSWSTSDPDVASVSQSGLVTAVGGGTADITVTTEDGSYTAQCKVTVNVPVTGVQFDEVSASMGMDSSTTTLGYTVLPADASNKSVTWQSSNTAVAMIDTDTGVITPVGPGGTEITVTTVDGNFSDTLFLMVTSSLDTAKLTIVTESGYCPNFATVYNKASGYVVEYPGIPVGAYGEVEAPVPSGQDTCTVGVSLLNTLIAGTSASPGADPESLYMVEGDLNADNVIDGTDYTILVQRMHFGGGLSEYGLTGDINYDGVVDKLDLMMFSSPVAYTGQSRFMQEGYDIESPEIQTNFLRSADKGFWVPARSLLETKESGEGRYEVSLQAPSEPVNMLQIALEGDISETSAAAPEGFKLIGAYAEDGKSVVAIGSTEKGGSVVPADVPIVTVKATETPSVIYGEHDTVMQRADEYGIENIPLEMSDDAGGAVSYSGSGGSGCNFGLGALTLLIAAPLLFRNKHGR